MKRESVNVLEECITLQSKKSADYQADVSEIKQAEYYPHGVTTIYDIMHAKMLRIKSVLAKMEAGGDANYESVEDSCKDLINYSSFMVSYLRGKMDGQDPSRDAFNRSRDLSIDNITIDPIVFQTMIGDPGFAGGMTFTTNPALDTYTITTYHTK